MFRMTSLQTFNFAELEMLKQKGEQFIYIYLHIYEFIVLGKIASGIIEKLNKFLHHLVTKVHYSTDHINSL